MDDPFKEEILKYLSEKRGQEITESTRLNADIGMAGDDANLFLEEFAERYEVDFSGFKFDRYFAPESSGIRGCLIVILIAAYLAAFMFAPFVVLMATIYMLPILLLGVGVITYHSLIKKKGPYLTAGHLVEVARRKVWFEPESEV